ncbi:MAG: precorrin-8X methylmutase [Planctomycetota bacterium]
MLSAADIEAQSFAIIDAEADPGRFDPLVWPVVRRMIHAAGEIDLQDDVLIERDAVQAGIAAVRAGAPIWTDWTMSAAGISGARLAAVHPAYRASSPRSLSEREGLAEFAKAKGVTRSAAAVLAAARDLPRSIVVIGNAPTALEMLLDLVRDGLAPPRFVVGNPVGFVGAAESKERLAAEAPFPFVTIRGRRGGSPAAVAALNAIAILAAETDADGRG